MVSRGGAYATLGEGNRLAVTVQVGKLEDVEYFFA